MAFTGRLNRRTRPAIPAAPPRWRKVRRDLTYNKMRTLLVALSIGVGVFVIGMIAGARDIIVQSLAVNAARMSPPSATLTIDSFGEDLLASVRQMPGVAVADARRNLMVRVRTASGGWRDLQLFAIPRYDRMSLNRVFPQTGAWPAPRGQLLLERASLPFLSVSPGQDLTIELPNSKQVQMRIAGSAFDLSQPPAAMFGLPSGYITMDTLSWLGEAPTYNQLYLSTKDPGDWGKAQLTGARVRDAVERQGPKVLTMSVPQPGRFWAMATADSLLLLLGALGVLSLVMSGFLVVNTASALLTQQIRQIGIMKSLGAETGQLTAMYLTQIVVFGLIALAIGIPVGAYAAQGLVAGATQSLNFDPLPFRLSGGTLALELAAGLALPALAALAPIVSGSRITIREAISNRAGLAIRESVLDRVLRRLRLSRPFILSLRNTLRKKARLALTMAALVLASAIFVGVLSVRASILQTNEDAFQYTNYNVQLDLVQLYPAATIRQQALAEPGVERVEAWQTVSAFRERPNGAKGATLQVLGIDPGSGLVRPVVSEGRWLQPGDRHGIVLDSLAVKDEPDVHPGDNLTLRIGTLDTSWRVIGIVKGFATGGAAYVNQDDLGSALGTFGLANRAVVVTRDHGLQAETAVYRALEQRFERANLGLGATMLQEQLRATVQAGWDVVVGALLLMAVLLGLAGGLGLMATMSISVVERTREIGVMRAIGASDSAIMRIVIGEGTLIGLASWAVGVLASLPLSRGLSSAVGVTFINAPLSYVYSGSGALLWLVLMMAMAGLASWFPARRAARLTVREVLAYEG